MPTPTSAADLRPEIDVLLCCARRALDARCSARVSQALQMKIDWAQLIHLADENGLLPLLSYHLARFSDAIPPDWTVRVRESTRENAIRALFLISELQRIIERLRRRGVSALPYKGPILAYLAYGDATLRQFDDLDIVVAQASMDSVYEEMEALDYEPRFSRERFLKSHGKNIPGEYVFVHRVNRAIVEFHTEATLRHFPKPPDLEGMLSRATAISLNGRQVSTFSLPDTMLMLCVHGAKDFWSRLIWVADIAALSTMITKADWGFLLARAKECDSERMVGLGLWLANSLFDFESLATAESEFDRTRVKIGTALRDQLLNLRPLSQSLWWRSLYRIGMVSPLWKGVAYWLRLSTAPAEEDWPTGGGVSKRSAPYALLRPLRLLRKYRRAKQGPADREA